VRHRKRDIRVTKGKRQKGADTEEETERRDGGEKREEMEGKRPSGTCKRGKREK
jgi:hypothetical protein